MLIKINKWTEGGRYLIACARIRDITVPALIHKLVERIGDDKLVLAILDDESQQQRTKHQHRFHEKV